MADLTIRPATARRDLSRFIAFPYAHYRDNQHWIPPLRQDVAHALDPKKNPFFEHGRIQPFLAEDTAGNVVGRIAGIVNGMHLKKYEDGNGFFGFFECVDREDVARGLLDAAAGWLRSQGLTGMRGPANPSLNDTAGLLVGGFDRAPSILMPYNPPYHERYLLAYGFERAMTMWAYYVHEKYVSFDRLRRGAELLHRRNPGLTIRPIDMKRFDEEARTILRIYNDAWANNWGHVPMTDAEFEKLAKDMKQVVDPKIVFILEKDGEPIAFSVSLPNVNLLLRHLPDGRLFPTGLPKLLLRARFGNIYEIRTALMGVLQEYQGRGLDALLNLATIEEGLRHGYVAAELSWVLDANKRLINHLEAMNAVVDKEYAMYEMRFGK